MLVWIQDAVEENHDDRLPKSRAGSPSSAEPNLKALICRSGIYLQRDRVKVYEANKLVGAFKASGYAPAGL